MARVKRRPGIGRVTRYCVPVAAVAGPTVLLNADWSTDTILDEVSAPAGNGSTVTSWTMATGGVWTSALAVAAGAADQPTYITASGVHTNGAFAALTVATPITIPADTDCVIYVVANLSAYETAGAMLGMSSAAAVRLEIEVGDTELGHRVFLNFSAGGQAFLRLSATVTGVYLFRLTRAAGVWSIAATGVASAAMTPTGTVTGAISFDTLMAYSLAGSGLDTFASSGLYLQKIKIWSGTSDPDTAYETANGGTL